MAIRSRSLPPNNQTDVKRTLSEGSRGEDGTQDRFDGKFVITRSWKEDVPLPKMWVGKFTDWVRPRVTENLHCKPWLVSAEMTPS